MVRGSNKAVGRLEQDWGDVMRCMACGGTMRVVALEPCDAFKIGGFAYKTWECGSCQETERRLFFSRMIGRAAVPAEPTRSASPTDRPPARSETASEALLRRSKLNSFIRHLPPSAHSHISADGSAASALNSDVSIGRRSFNQGLASGRRPTRLRLAGVNPNSTASRMIVSKCLDAIET
jgi:hypothetical protein